jgi:thiamine transporter
VIYFSSYAPSGWNVWLYSLAYNASYMLPEIVISTMVMAIVWPRLKWTDAETGH